MDLSDIRNVITIALILMGAAGTIAVMRHMLKDHLIRLNSHAKRFKEHEDRIDKHGDDLVRLNTIAESAVTADDVRAEYVSKDLFKQYEKNVEQHFTNIERSQKEMLELLRRSNG